MQEQHKVELKTVAKQRVEDVERRAELRLASTRQELQSEALLQQRQMESELARAQVRYRIQYALFHPFQTSYCIYHN